MWSFPFLDHLEIPQTHVRTGQSSSCADEPLPAHLFQHGFHSLCLTKAVVRWYFWMNRVYKIIYLQCSLFSSELSSTFLPFVGSGLLFAFMCKCANLQSLSVIGRKGKCKRWINTDVGNSIFGPSSTSSEPSRSVAFILLNFTFTQHFHQWAKSFC